VFAASIDFGVALLAAESFDLADGHPFDTYLAQGVFDFLQFERFDYGFDFFHRIRYALCCGQYNCAAVRYFSWTNRVIRCLATASKQPECQRLPVISVLAKSR